MCFHKANTASVTTLNNHYGVHFRELDYALKFYENGYDFQPEQIITAEFATKTTVCNWGLIPWWSKSNDEASEMKARTLNAKSETIYELASFRDSAKQGKRTLIPATGFFEWRWLDAKGKSKVPYFISSKDQPVFSFAGLYSTWKDRITGELINTYTIITCPAGPLMSKIHNNKLRQPVVIKKEFEKDWLNQSLKEDDVKAFCQPLDDSFWKYDTITREVGNPKALSKNNPRITDHVDYPELALLDA